MMKIPAKMYSKGPKENPAPAKHWDTSGTHAYGDADIRLLNPPDPEFAMPQMTYSLIDKLGKK